ncbi:uncharacterized protein Dwil_GK26773 [Drosophila willistoni]|uniref:Insect cuticle protein n=1 Tax=Drosophila willistoni TaxID=7260 RepID=A0A0Q9X3Z6_DROWI|nr:uncharacterized protein LOC26528775 [Drosophila willistoni]KRF98988.1 uncharacterized protein Dwil_GK26773 [Drosophila willistoni]
MSALTSIFWFVLLLLIIKIYTNGATPLAVESEVKTNVKKNSNEPGRLSNYFLHEPYGPNTYAFGYEIEDPLTQNIQFRDERRYVNGTIEGSFGYVRPDKLIEITHYKADEASGYLAQRQSFRAGDNPPPGASKWPTRRPEIILDLNRPTSDSNMKVTWDPNSHLNLSVNAVADKVEHQLKQQHGLDLNHIDVAKDVLQPAVLDVINGKAPLRTNATTGGMSFKTVHNFIPEGFPIVPFELPSQSDPTTSTENTTPIHKYQKSKSNIEEKAPQIKPTVDHNTTELPLPQPLVNNESLQSPNPSWYHKIIEANRREFLQHLPNLNGSPESSPKLR